MRSWTLKIIKTWDFLETCSLLMENTPQKKRETSRRQRGKKQNPNDIASNPKLSVA